jgi:hypothetical protein
MKVIADFSSTWLGRWPIIGPPVKAGSQYVLYNSATKTVYQLDDQDQPERFAGQKVTVSGSLDAASNAIHVASIKAAL